MYTAEEQATHRRYWANTLFSGQYQQTTGRLRDERGTFCCLGVACHISKLGVWTESEEGGLMYSVPTPPGNTETEKYQLPQAVMDWLGVSHNHVIVRDTNGETETLLNYNDNGWTFREIAEIIMDGKIETV